MANQEYTSTRRSLHAVAELVLAGPQYRACGTIRLRATPDGFATTGEPDLRVEGGRLVGPGRSVELGGTPAELARAMGVAAGAPEGLYQDGCGMTVDDRLDVRPEALLRLTRAFDLGLRALGRITPLPPVLWPEHFDLALDREGTGLGVSPGDSYIDEPYAYVSPPNRRREPFWNMPFGAARPMQDFGDAAALEGFFTEGLRLAGSPGAEGTGA